VRWFLLNLEHKNPYLQRLVDEFFSKLEKKVILPFGVLNSGKRKKKLFAATNIRHFGPNAVKLC
jgi:hypothetical protein